MADDTDLDRSGGVADEGDVLDVAAGGNQRRRDGQERVARAHGIDHRLGEGGNARNAGLDRERIAAERAVGDDDVVAIDPVMQLLLDHGGDIAEFVGGGEPRFRRVDADIIGLRISRDQIVAEIAAVALGVDGEEFRICDQRVDRARRDHAMAEIGGDYHVGAANALAGDPIDFRPLALPERRIVHGVNLEQLVQIAEFDIAQFAGGRPSKDADRGQLHVRAQMRFDEFLRIIVAAEHGDDLDRLAEARDVVGRRQHAAGELFASPEQRGDDVFLGGFAERRNILVFVDDGVADQHDMHVLHAVDQLEQALRAAAFADLLQIIAQRRIVDVEVAVDQRRGTEGDVAGEHDASAVTFDGVALGFDLAGDVVVGILVVRTLDVDVGPDGVEYGFGAGGVVDADPVDIGERSQHFRPHVLRENWPAGSLVDVAIGGNRYHHDVAFVARGLDVPDMA